MTNPFKLVYLCENCSATVEAQTTDGKVHPPPDYCVSCTSIEKPKRGKHPGETYLGLRLDQYFKQERKWRIQCLFCTQYFMMGSNNIGNQKSCGCLKASTLVVNYFSADGSSVNMRCKECELVKDYSLETGSPIYCASGCVGKNQVI